MKKAKARRGRARRVNACRRSNSKEARNVRIRNGPRRVVNKSIISSILRTTNYTHPDHPSTHIGRARIAQAPRRDTHTYCSCSIPTDRGSRAVGGPRMEGRRQPEAGTGGALLRRAFFIPENAADVLEGAMPGAARRSRQRPASCHGPARRPAAAAAATLSRGGAPCSDLILSQGPRSRATPFA